MTSASLRYVPQSVGVSLARIGSMIRRDIRFTNKGSVMRYLVVVNIAVIWLISIAVIWNNRQIAIRDWSATAARSNQLAAAYAAEAMDAAGLVLDSMVDWVGEEKTATPQEFNSIFVQRQYYERLRQRIGSLQYIDKAAFVSADGRILSFTEVYPAPTIDVSDRDYFIEQAGANPPAVSLGKSVQDRGTGKWTFFLAKRAQSRSGTFLGVVLVGFEPGHIANYFQATADSNNGAVSLWRSDGTLLATTKRQPDILGKRFPDAPSMMLYQMNHDGMVAFIDAPHLSGDKEQRLLAVHPIAGAPAFIALSIGENTVVAPWRRETYYVIAIAAALSIVSILAWLLTLVEQSSRMEAQATLMQSAKLATLGRMATAMAHEINQPLNIIHLAAENALCDLETVNKEAAPRTPVQELYGSLTKRFERILSQTERAGVLISHMRIFGRVPREKVTPFDAREACHAALDLTNPQLRNSGATVESRLGDASLVVTGHKTLLEQVVVNLLLNAADAMAIAESPLRQVTVACSSGSDKVIVEVSDTGPGIPADIRERIFEPFFTTKPVGRGTGLGLAFSHGIVREMGGTLSLVAGTASTFRIELPARAQEVPMPSDYPERVAA